MKKILRFLASEDGPTAVEYAVMLAMIVMVCIGAIATMGQNVSSSFTDSGNKITTAIGS
jgi:pilus assembly protein Flp/PilA